MCGTSFKTVQYLGKRMVIFYKHKPLKWYHKSCAEQHKGRGNLPSEQRMEVNLLWVGWHRCLIKGMRQSCDMFHPHLFPSPTPPHHTPPNRVHVRRACGAGYDFYLVSINSYSYKICSWCLVRFVFITFEKFIRRE